MSRIELGLPWPLIMLEWVIKDARGLAVELGKDPNIWNELAEVLPLLAQKKYYEKLTYGYARGHEPVLYVKRIRNFQDILEREIEIGLKNTSAPKTKEKGTNI